jgi:hypothetical protein
VIANGLAAILFMIGYMLLGIAMIRTVHCLAGTGAGCSGCSDLLLAFGIAQLVSAAAWPIAILAVESRRRPRLAPLSAVARTDRLRCAGFRKAHLSTSTGSSESLVANRPVLLAATR